MIVSATYEDANGQRRAVQLTSERPASHTREEFAVLVAYGHAPLDAYIQAYKKPPPSNAIEVKQYQACAQAVMGDSDVRVRIMELRRPIQRKLAKKWEYKLDHAFEDLQKAWDLAYMDADAKALTKIVELKARLAKILSDEVNVHHTHGILDKETTEMLLAMKEAVARKKGAVKVISAESVEEKEKPIAGPPSPPISVG